MARNSFLLAPLIAVMAAVLAGYINVAGTYRFFRVFGVFRAHQSTIDNEGLEVVRLPETTYCEDLHHHQPSGLIFAACEAKPELRHAWFPPLAIFDDVTGVAEAQGFIKTIDPKTMKVTQLEYENFSSSFMTHGIDVIDDPDTAPGKAVYIFAVNHRPNAKYYGPERDEKAHKADSVVEVFHHEIGKKTARHIRTVKHELIETPNDVLALSPTSFLVTNDHFYREGTMRLIEDLVAYSTWSTTIYAQFERINADEQESDRVQASVALRGIQNNNGIGRGRHENEVVVATADGGSAYFGQLKREKDRVTIEVTDEFHSESTLDNPTYFIDPYANSTFDASGLVLAGLPKAHLLPQTARSVEGRDGAIVWHVQDRRAAAADSARGAWEAKLLLQDNSDNIRTGTTALLVPIDPAKEKGGGRRAWLFVTGFASKNVLAVKIGL